jgi:mRNA-degrading endonuclease toxin of MazEF toxin-antitoxin module
MRGIPSEVSLTPADGVPVDCVVNLDDIMTIPKALVGRRIAALSEERLAQVADAIRYSLALYE